MFVPDDPIVRTIEKTGYAPWFGSEDMDYEEEYYDHYDDADLEGEY